jgi:hypothetical protein
VVGPRPPLCTLHPPFEEKKEFPRNFSKKEFPRNLKKVFPPKFTVNNTDRKLPIPAVSDTGKYQYRKNDWYHRAPPPKNGGRLIYEYVDRKKKDIFFTTNLL